MPIRIRAYWPIRTKALMPVVCEGSNRCPTGCRRAITTSVTAMRSLMFRPMIRRSTTSSSRATKCGSNPNTSLQCSARGARRSTPAAGMAVGMPVGDSGLRGGVILRSVGIGVSPIIRGTTRGIVPDGMEDGAPDGTVIGAIGVRTTTGSTAIRARITAVGVRREMQAAIGTMDTDAVTTVAVEEAIIMAVAVAVTTTVAPAIATMAIIAVPATTTIIISRVRRTIPTETTGSIITMDITTVGAEVTTAGVVVPAASAAVRADTRAAAAEAVEVVAEAATTAGVDWQRMSS